MSQPPHQPDAGQPDPHQGPPQGQPSYPPAGPSPYGPPADGQPPYPPAGPPQYAPPAEPSPYAPPAGPSPYAPSPYAPPASGQPPYPPAGPPAYGPPAGGTPPYQPAGPPTYGPPAGGTPPYPPAGPPTYAPPASGQPPYPPAGPSPYGAAPQQPAPGWQPPYPPAGGVGHAPDAFAPGGYPAAPRKTSPVLKIVLISVAAIVLLCFAGVAVTVLLTKDKVADVVQAAKTTVVEPSTLGGRSKVTQPELVSIVDALSDQMHQVPGATSSVGAMYGDPAQQDLVMVAAASSLTGNPQAKYDEFVTNLQTGGFRGVDMVDTDPGPLGGIARCGDGAPGGTDMAICIWSDNGSVGMIAMLLKPVSALQGEFVAMRGQIEQRS